MGAFFEWLASSAVSLTVSGNTGISPFLSLFLIGVIEAANPGLLNMDGVIQYILAKWYSLTILAILTILEFVGKCVPVIDEAIDSIEIFIVPLFAILGSLGTFGILDLLNTEGTTGALDAVVDDGGGGGSERQLQETNNSIGDGALTTLKVMLCIIGIVLALLIHLFKMLIRFTGLICCGGCCQPCITCVEITTVACGICFAIFIRQIAIITAAFLFVCASYAIYKKWFAKKDDDDNNNNQQQQGQGQGRQPQQQPTTPPQQPSPPTPTPQSGRTTTTVQINNNNNNNGTTTTTTTTTVVTTNSNTTHQPGSSADVVPISSNNNNNNNTLGVDVENPVPPIAVSTTTDSDDIEVVAVPVDDVTPTAPPPPPPSMNPNYVAPASSETNSK